MDNEKKYDFLVDEQLQRYEEMASDNPTAQHYSSLAKAYNVRGMFKHALEAAEKATRLDEVHFTGWFEYAIAATTTDEDHLRDILERLEALNAREGGTNGKIKTAMALTHYYLANDPKAREIASSIIESGDANSHTYEVLGYIAYNNDDAKEAIRHFLKAIEVNEANFRAHWMIGHCWFELNDLEAARNGYQATLDIQPYFANAWFSIGKIYLLVDDVQPAYQSFARCLSINPRMWDCYFTQADYYLGHRLHGNALAFCSRIIELQPEAVVAAETYNYMGEVYLASGSYQEAVYSFDKAIELESDDAFYYNNLGVTLMKLNDVDAAMKNFEKAKEMEPEWAYPVTKLGQVYLHKKNLEKALDMFQESLSIDSEEYWAWLGIAEVHRKNRHHRKALEAILKAAEITSDDSDVYNFMGISFQNLRDYESAERAYKRSLELDSLNRKAANNLGFLYERFYQKTKDDIYREKAVDAWRQRLLICRDTNTSMKGSISHLLKLGVEDKVIETWLQEDDIDGDI
jgi:tetratricopeptide (TPR) repeat protein